MNQAPTTLDNNCSRVARARRRPFPDLEAHAVVSADYAFRVLNIDRGTGYKAIREGTFPVPVLRIGRVIRIPTVALSRLLQVDNAHDTPDTYPSEPLEAR